MSILVVIIAIVGILLLSKYIFVPKEGTPSSRREPPKRRGVSGKPRKRGADRGMRAGPPPETGARFRASMDLSHLESHPHW